uniref:Uncharacterized protein MLCL622.11c n=1 Tax=Mycobacterium leprae TaxID=1769 RepID=O06074_MYCLR|nr:unknown [Mycobacterium leprae]
MRERGEHIGAISVSATSTATISSRSWNASRQEAELASEWAVLLLSTIMAQNRPVRAVRISSETAAAGCYPHNDGDPVTSVQPKSVLNSGTKDECRCWLPFFAKFPVSIHINLFRYEHSMLFYT